ncbi:DUF1778 domain-containing protein [Jannaschia sp. R86511]|uniref:type II toxin-antitoxin system TacA family antitoxin n=1 Tax=Jannaschia sp. R86511 TaxID=3093853 RepID=UPI0036D3CDE5
MPSQDASAAATTTTKAATKDQRANIRMTSRQDQVLRSAAAATDRTVTDFIVDSAVERAERILADRRWFFATPEQWDEFNRLLEAPMPTSKLEKLAARKTSFDDSTV